MKLAVPKERLDGETRVAVSPDSVKKLSGLGFSVIVETGAGDHAALSDADFESAGATIASDAASAVDGADVVFKVRHPLDEEVETYGAGTKLAAIMAPHQNADVIEKLAEQKVDAFAMDLMPRITRAQSMDVLSSQSNLAGYKAVIDGAAEFGRALPMMMTAAGTIAPARVMVMGAGVAGLQAIATAKRLGAIVSATDVRPAAKEQVESLGGKFVMVESEETKEAETSGGYAKEMSDEYKQKQAELIAETLKTQDIVICTALIPGRPAPTLITADMVGTMKAGSVIVDLAVESGGNCELSEVGEIVQSGGVKIVGHVNVPGRLSRDASNLYAKNLLNFITLFVDAESKSLKIDWDDEIVTGTCLTKDGAVIHPSLKSDA
ncbi:MAG: Re/Si-specific NAD(P)(+) transhydrogenase subunit alpha [Pseudomonadota bacterium]